MTGSEPIGHTDSAQDLGARSLKGFAWLIVERGTYQVIGFLTFVTLGRLLGPAEFGLVAAATVVVFALRIFVSASVSRALVQRPEITEVEIDTAFWTSLAIGGLLCAATALAAPLIGDLFDNDELVPIVRVLGIVFVLSALDATQSALVDRQMLFRVQAIRRFTATVLSSGLAVGLALGGAEAWALVAQVLAYEATLVVMLWTLTEWRPRARWSASAFRHLFSFGLQYLGVRISELSREYADNLLVGVVLGPIALGLYVVAFRVLSVMYELIVMTVYQVAVPAFARLQHQPQRLELAFMDVVALGAVVAWPLFAGLSAASEQVIPLLFGDQWRESAPIVQALALGGIAQVAAGPMQSIMIATGRIKWELRYTVMAMVVQVGAFAVAVHLGVVAIAWALAISSAVLWPVRFLYVAHHVGLSAHTYVRSIAGPAAATAVMGAAVFGARRLLEGSPPGVTVAVEVAVGLVVYLAALPLLAPAALKLLLGTARLLRMGQAESAAAETA